MDAAWPLSWGGHENWCGGSGVGEDGENVRDLVGKDHLATCLLNKIVVISTVLLQLNEKYINTFWQSCSLQVTFSS